MTSVDRLIPKNFIGFDNLFFDDIRRGFNGNVQNYPRYDIEKLTETTYAIRVALAGFKADEISVNLEESVLSISGGKDSNDEGRHFIHRGISQRRFDVKFRLHEFVEVKGADFVDGILSVNLEYVVPEEKKPRKIAITTTGLIDHDQEESQVVNVA